MMSHVFALIIGIDTYQSGGIWNLQSCVEDAKKMKRWLMNGLNVPREQIILLLDSDATKQAIEDSLMHHLVNNPSIERGDPLFIYFAGHGSCLPAPTGWFEDDSGNTPVNVICPYDHDTKVRHGRNAGISDRSFMALLEQLELAKGDNITVFLDCCFSPVQNRINILDRSITRWTMTSKASSDDLYRGLWHEARGKPYSVRSGLFNPTSAYTLLAACPLGQKAIEGKGGGRFTTAFLAKVSKNPIHRTTYTRLIDDLLASAGESQQFLCSGKYKNKTLFDDVPFTTDKSFSTVTPSELTQLIKVDLGEIHGVVLGSEMTVHLHNYCSSPNPPIAISIVEEVHPTYCLARVKSQTANLPQQCWAKVTRWNNRQPFRVYLKSSLMSLIRMLKLKRSIKTSTTSSSSAFKNGVNISTVSEPATADMSVILGANDIVVMQNNSSVAEGTWQTVQVGNRSPVEVIDDGALFSLHLLHQNVDKPLRNLIDIELYQLDPASLSKVGRNYLHDSEAVIGHENGAIYELVLHNKAKFDIWPYIFYMDPKHQSSTLLYSPDSSLKPAPLSGGGSLEIGVGRLRSGAANQNRLDFAYLKLYLSSIPVNMNLLQCGASRNGIFTNHPAATSKQTYGSDSSSTDEGLWDTSLTSLVFLRDSVAT